MLSSAWVPILLFWPIDLNYPLAPSGWQPCPDPQSDVWRPFCLAVRDFLPCPLTQPSSSPCCSKTLSQYQLMGTPPDSCLLLKQNGLSLQSQPSCPSGVIQPHAGFQPLLLPTVATEESTILPCTQVILPCTQVMIKNYRKKNF